MATWDCPLDSQGPPRDPPWLLRGDPGPPTARRKDANVSLRFADLRFCTPSVEFRTLWRSDLSRNAIKTNVILTILKTHCSSPLLCFSSRDGPRAPSETPFGERSGDFGVPRAPLEIGEGPPWAPWAAPRATLGLRDIELLRKKAEPSQHEKNYSRSKNHTLSDAQF